MKFLEMGKNPHCLSSFGSGSFQLWKNESSVLVLFFVHRLRFCSVWFYAGSYPYLL